MQFRTRMFLLIATLIAPAFLASCGGGGGGGGGAPTPIVYSGLTTQASLSAANAEEIALGAVMGLDTGGVVPVVPLQVEDTGSSQEEAELRISQLGRIFYNIADSDIFQEPQANSGAALAIMNVSETLQSDCGSVVIDLNFNDQTGEFSGAMAFHGYCDSGITLNGIMEVLGEVDPNTGDLSMSIVFDSLSFIEGVQTFTMNGQIDVLFSDLLFDSSILINIDLRDGSDSTVYRFQDYRQDMTFGAGFVSVNMSGRFYHPSYGYVVLSTPEDLIIFDEDTEPSSGELLCSGQNNTAARMTFAAASYQLDADTDGDGIFDWSAE